MFNNLSLIKRGDTHYIDSRDIAELIGKRHSDLLRDIQKYCNYIGKLDERKITLVDFFLQSRYIDSKGEARPHYLITKKGAEVIANKLTGEKGVLFTACYVTKFHAMEEHLRAKREQELLSTPSLTDCNNTAKIVLAQMRRTGASTEHIFDFLSELYKPLGIIVADEDDFNNLPRTYTAAQIAKLFGIYSMYGNPHAQAVSCILNENIFISKEHKFKVSANYENGIIGGFRYDEHALKKLGNWLHEHNYPREIYGFDRTYHVIYGSQ